MGNFICVATPIKDEAYCLERYIDNVSSLFDGIVALVDSRTTDDSMLILSKSGAHVKPVTFEDFGQMGNAVLDYCRELGFEYAFILNPDEMILPEIYASVIDIVKNNPGVDLFLMARRNWYDLEMTDERVDVFPDWQCKIVKLTTPGLRYVGAVHERIIGTSSTMVLPIDLTTEHFNLYYYKTGDQDYEKKIEQYNELASKQV